MPKYTPSGLGTYLECVVLHDSSLSRFNNAGVLDEVVFGLGQIAAFGRREGTAYSPSDFGIRP